MRSSTLFIVLLVVVVGCGTEKKATEPPCDINAFPTSYAAGEVVSQVVPLEIQPTVILPGGGRGEFYRSSFAILNGCDTRDTLGIAWSYVLRPVAQPDSIYLETVTVWTGGIQVRVEYLEQINQLMRSPSSPSAMLAQLRIFIAAQRNLFEQDGLYGMISATRRLPANASHQDSVWMSDMTWGSRIHA